MMIMLAYTIYGIKARTGTRWHRYGPTFFVALAVPLVMADLCRHLTLDHMHVGWMLEYRSGCGSETVRCLTVAGVFFTIVSTYLGFTMLFIGSFWNANICDKLKEIKEKWRQLREGAADDAEHAPVAPADEDDGDFVFQPVASDQLVHNQIAAGAEPAPVVAVH